jgi:hypothetical protein
MAEFEHFAAIDWSGAAGERHHGIAVALCGQGDEPPRLIPPPRRGERRWSRGEVLDWLLGKLPESTLVGLDLGISLPFADLGAFFPGWSDSPASARALWTLVDAVCEADKHLAANSFVDHAELSRFFRRHGGREGDLFGADGTPGGPGRFRVTERAQRKCGCNPYSNFNLVGAAQVGKSSLTGMRVLHRLGRHLPVWPVDPLPRTGSAIVEIYTSLAAIAAGRRAGQTKLRNYEDLNLALAALQSRPVGGSGVIADHASDALLTAAWLRQAAPKREYWHPKLMTPQIAQTEGWTFGAL